MTNRPVEDQQTGTYGKPMCMVLRSVSAVLARL